MQERQPNCDFHYTLPSQEIFDAAQSLLASANGDHRQIAEAVLDVACSVKQIHDALQQKNFGKNVSVDLSVWLNHHFGNALPLAKQAIHSENASLRTVSQFLIQQATDIQQAKASFAASRERHGSSPDHE